MTPRHASHQFIIRRGRESDVSSIIGFSAALALETEGRELDPARLRHGTQALLGLPTYGFFMVAEISHPDRRLVGQLMITYEWSDWRNGVFWWIQSVYVDPAWRRQGVFRRLHDTVMREATSDPGVCGIRLYVEKANHAAKRVYGRVGLASSGYEVYETDFTWPKHSNLHPR
ncbi:MAG: GNAT family N-acetyltransferase [Nitrospira sp.]|nr:GNAT family N-acetyltransferase [Nitrospira sp.]